MSIYWWLIQNGMTVVALLPVVWAVCWIFRWRPACQHWLWLLLLIKLVLPPIVVWPYSITIVQWPTSATTSTVALTSPDSIGLTEAIDLEPTDQTGMINETSKPSVTATVASLPESTGKTHLLLWVTWAGLLVWIFGSCTAACFAWRRVMVTLRLLKQSQPPTQELQTAVNEMSVRFGRQQLIARISRQVTSPCVIGLGRPVLIWPQHLADEEIEKSLEPLLAHEIAHIQRGDHWVVWLELGVGMIWWWNPVYWLICRQLHETRELACDAIAIGATGRAPREYALKLLELTTHQSCSEQPIPIYGVGAVSHRSLQRRLEMVFENRLNGRLSLVGYLMIGLLMIPLVPTWTWGSNEPQANPQRKDAIASEAENKPKSEAKSPTEAPATNQDQGAAANKLDSAPERPKAKSFPRLIHPGLALNDPVMKELGLEHDSAVTAEIRKMNQDIVNEIQKGLSELSKAGGLKSGATIEIYANVVPKYVETLKKLLTPEQFTRLQQIHWQQAGLDALRDPELAKALNLSADQQERLATADEDVEKQQAELNGQQKTLEKERKELADKGENFDEITTRIQRISEKKQNLGAERNTRYQQVLTAEQQTKLAELKGKFVEFPKRAAPVGGRPGTPTTARPGGLMALALREPILKELGINQDASELAEIRRLSEAHSRELQQQLQNEGAHGDQEKVQEIEGKVQAKYNVDLKKLLTPEQFIRLQQIQWQQLGTYVLYDVDIVNALEITKEQKDKIYALNYEMFQIRRKLLNPPDGSVRGVVSAELQKKMDDAKAEQDKKINQVLSEEQQKKLAELKGTPFDMALLRVRPTQTSE